MEGLDDIYDLKVALCGFQEHIFKKNDKKSFLIDFHEWNE